MKKSVTVIGGADGPISIFLAGKFSGKKPLKEQIRQFIYRCRRKRIEKRIRANPHTLKQVIVYAAKKYHAAEISKTKIRYKEEYACTKESLIIMHKPELLGNMAEIARPEVFDEESIKEMYRQIQLRSEMAASIPDSEMPMDFHSYEIRLAGGQLEIQIDFKWDIFGMSYSGNKKTMKELKKITRELYIYYGVSEDDIKDKTERYSSLLATLCD